MHKRLISNYGKDNAGTEKIVGNKKKQEGTKKDKKEKDDQYKTIYIANSTKQKNHPVKGGFILLKG